MRTTHEGRLDAALEVVLGVDTHLDAHVALAYASERGAGFVDRSLYLPREWTNALSRRAFAAGVPEEVTFANKIELAKRMLQRAFAAGIPAHSG